MPLSEHEQRILDEIERRLAEEDPRLAQSVGKTSLATHLLRKIRWGVVAFAVGFALLLLYFLSLWAAVAGFAVMLVSALVVYHYLRRMGSDQIRVEEGRGAPFTSALARLADRLKRPRGGQG